MESKLTLKLDKEIIEKAKTYAHKHNISLSKIVENYFLLIVTEKKSAKCKPTPLVKELSGIIDLDYNFDEKNEYAKYLTEKYK